MPELSVVFVKRRETGWATEYALRNRSGELLRLGTEVIVFPNLGRLVDWVQMQQDVTVLIMPDDAELRRDPVFVGYDTPTRVLP